MYCLCVLLLVVPMTVYVIFVFHAICHNCILDVFFLQSKIDAESHLIVKQNICSKHTEISMTKTLLRTNSAV